MRPWRVVAVATGVALGLVPLAGCLGDETTDDASDGVRIAAFDFAESELLAEIYAQAMESHGVPVDRLGAVGPREIVAPALRIGEIDVVPDYVGTAAAYFGADGRDLESLRARIEGFGLEALEPADAADSNVFVVTAETARTEDLARVSDLADFAPTARFGGPVECPERPLCLLGLRTTYGLEFAEFVPQNSLVLTADALRRGEIDVGLLFSTSAELDPDDLVELVDDRGLQPPENVVPLVRDEALREWGPSVRASLDEVSALLTTADLRGLNRRVDSGEAVEDVAASWLAGVLNGP